jgi:hypothetical protein
MSFPPETQGSGQNEGYISFQEIEKILPNEVDIPGAFQPHGHKQALTRIGNSTISLLNADRKMTAFWHRLYIRRRPYLKAKQPE